MKYNKLRFVLSEKIYGHFFAKSSLMITFVASI